MSNVAAGKDTDDEGESLNDVEKTLDRMNIKLRDSVGEWRSFEDVLNEVAKKWSSGEFNDVEKSQIATAIAGVRQQENFRALMNNWSEVERLTTVATTSTGKASQKMETYLDSVEAKTNKLKTTWEEFIMSLNQSESYKDFLDFLMWLLNNIPTIIGLISSFMIAWKGQKALESLVGAKGLLTKLLNNLKIIPTAIGTFALEMKQAGGGLQGFGAACKYVTGATSTMSGVISVATGIISALTLAVTLGITAYNNWKQANVKAAQAAKEEADGYEEQVVAIENVISKYKEIYNSTDDYATKQQNLKSLSDELISTYGKEAEALDLLNGKYEENIAVMQDAANEKRLKERDALAVAAEKGESNLNNWTNAYWNTDYTISDKNNYINKDSQFVKDIQEIIKGDGENTGGYFLTNFVGDKYKGLRMRNETTNEQNLKYAQDLQEYYENNLEKMTEGERELLQGFISQIKSEVDEDASSQYENKQNYQLAKVTQNSDGSLKQEIIDYQTQLDKQQELEKEYTEETNQEAKEKLKQRLAEQYKLTEESLNKVKSLYNSEDESQSTLSQKTILDYLGFGEDSTSKVQTNIYAGLSGNQKTIYQQIKEELDESGTLSEESRKKLANLKQELLQKDNGETWVQALNDDLAETNDISKINLQKENLMNEYNNIEDKSYEEIGRWLNGVNASLTDLGLNVDAQWYQDLSEGLKNGTIDFETFYNTVSEKCKLLEIDLGDLTKKVEEVQDPIKVLGSQSDFVEEMDNIDQLYDDASTLKSGGTLDNQRIVDLRNQYEELNDYIAESGDLTLKNGTILTDIAENAYEEGTKAIENQIVALEDYQDAILNTIDAMGLMEEFQEELRELDDELANTIDENAIKEAKAKGKFTDISKETADGVYDANEIIQDSEGKTYSIQQAIAQGILDTEDEKVKSKVDAAKKSMKALWEEAKVTEDTSIITADYIEQNKQALLDKGWTEEQITNAKTQLAGIQIDADGNISVAATEQAATTEDAQLATAKAFTSVTLTAISTAKSIASLFGIESDALNQAQTDLQAAQDTINEVEAGKEDRAKNAAQAYLEAEKRKKELEARINQYSNNYNSGLSNYNSSGSSGSSGSDYSAEDAAEDLADILEDIKDYEADIELDLEDQTEQLINHYNLEKNKLESLKEELDYYEGIYDSVEDTTKWLETQEKLLENQSKTIAELQKSNDKINKQREKIYKENSKYKVSGWFDSEGNDTLAYGDLINSFEYQINAIQKETAKKMRNIYNSVSGSRSETAIENAKDRIEELEKEADRRIEALEKEREKVENIHDSVSELNDAWDENQEAIRDALADMHDRIIDIRDTLVDQLMEQLEKAVDKQNESIEKDVTRMEQLVSIREKYYEILNETIDTQADLDSELQSSLDSFEYLDEQMRQLMFNEEDYKALSETLTGIQEDIAGIWEDHYNKIDSLTDDEMYKAEYITAETERQLDMKMKEYELAKAELDVAKAKTNLQNVQNERNVRMFVNGQWTWVADPDAVKDAQKQLADAEREKDRIEREQEQQKLIDKMEGIIDSDNLQIDENNELLERVQEAIEAQTQEVQSIEDALQNIKDTNLPALNDVLVGAFGSDGKGGFISELLANINKSTSLLTLSLKGYTTASAEKALKSGNLSKAEFEDLVESLGYSFNSTTGKVTTLDGSFSAHYKGWKKQSNSDTQLGTAGNGVQVTGNGSNANGSGGSSSASKFPRTGHVSTGSLPLRIRSGAGTNYKVLGLMPKGAKVTITGEANSGWAKVKYKGISGYASRQYLTYDQGGLATGKGVFLKDINVPERILSPKQTKSFDYLVKNLTTNPVLAALTKNPNIKSNLSGLGKAIGETKQYYFSNFTVQADNLTEFIDSLDAMIPISRK